MRASTLASETGTNVKEVWFCFSVRHRAVANLISLVRLQAPRRSNRVAHSAGHGPDANSGYADLRADFCHRIIQTTLIMCESIYM